MTMITAETIRQALRCDNPSCACHKPTGHVHCPAHEDTTPSLSVTERDGKPLFYCHGGCAQDRVVSSMQEKGIWPPGNDDRPRAQLESLSEPLAIYNYHDANGKLVFQVCRYQTPTGKTFRQRRPDGKGGWVWKMARVKPVPYRLPEILKADTIYIPEGEKDCNNLAALGLATTTNPGGAGKWRKEYNRHFQGKAVVILPDNDDIGRAHAKNVARNLHGVATSFKVVELPGLPEKGDVSEWLDGGGTVEQLLALVKAATEYEPGSKIDVPAQEENEKKPQAEKLIKLAGDAELFHDANLKGFATIEVAAHRETWPIRSKGFRFWLLEPFYQATGKAPAAQAMQGALGVLEAQAHFDGPEHEVYVRVAHLDGKIYIDLTNKSWEAVEITPQGWRVVNNPPVKFRRPRGLAPIPAPHPGGSLADLRPFNNCPDEDFPLVVAWIIGSFSSGPYPIMGLQSEHGSAKTTTAKVLKNMVDPSHSPQRAAPKDIRDLMISASNSWCLSFDNLSGIPPWLSDGLCRLSTGGGNSARQLYSDDEETILDAMRPQILNGIDSLVSRADLADRTILLELPQIEKGRRRPEKDLWKAFEAAQPGIYGAVFAALSAALRNFHEVNLAELPRMADFATWVVAAEPALPWEPGTFMAAYARNQAAVVEHSLEGDVVAVAVLLLIAERDTWEGAASDLLEALEALVPESTKRCKAWPKAANTLSNRLRRAATFLRATGIEVDWAKSGTRLISIRKGEQKTVQTVQTLEPCRFALDDLLDDPKSLDDATVHLDDPRTISDDPQKRPSTRKATDDKGLDDVDDVDDKKHSLSKADAKDTPLVQCGNCQNFTASLGAPGGRGHCSLGEKSWNGMSTQFSDVPHPCQSFAAKDSIKALAAWDKAIAQVVGEAVQALNPDGDLKEVVIR